MTTFLALATLLVGACAPAQAGGGSAPTATKYLDEYDPTIEDRFLDEYDPTIEDEVRKVYAPNHGDIPGELRPRAPRL